MVTCEMGGKDLSNKQSKTAPLLSSFPASVEVQRWSSGDVRIARDGSQLGIIWYIPVAKYTVELALTVLPALLCVVSRFSPSTSRR